MPDKTIRRGDEKSERRDWNFWQRVKNRQQREKCFFRMKKLPADKIIFLATSQKMLAGLRSFFVAPQKIRAGRKIVPRHEQMFL
jgi:hypothetical protein